MYTKLLEIVKKYGISTEAAMELGDLLEEVRDTTRAEVGNKAIHMICDTMRNLSEQAWTELLSRYGLHYEAEGDDDDE